MNSNHISPETTTAVSLYQESRLCSTTRKVGIVISVLFLVLGITGALLTGLVMGDPNGAYFWTTVFIGGGSATLLLLLILWQITITIKRLSSRSHPQTSAENRPKQPPITFSTGYKSVEAKSQKVETSTSLSTIAVQTQQSQEITPTISAAPVELPPTVSTTDSVKKEEGPSLTQEALPLAVPKVTNESTFTQMPVEAPRTNSESGDPFAKLPDDILDLIIRRIENLGSFYRSCKRFALVGSENRRYHQAALLVRRKFEVIYSSSSDSLWWQLKTNIIGFGEVHDCYSCRKNNTKLLSLIWQSENTLWVEHSKMLQFVADDIKQNALTWDTLSNEMKPELDAEQYKALELAETFFKLQTETSYTVFQQQILDQVNQNSPLPPISEQTWASSNERLLLLNIMGDNSLASLNRSEDRINFIILTKFHSRRNATLVQALAQDATRGIRSIGLAGALHTKKEVFLEFEKQKLPALSLFPHPKHQCPHVAETSVQNDDSSEQLRIAFINSDTDTIDEILDVETFGNFYRLLREAIERQIEINKAAAAEFDSPKGS
jgi:hypothetical protein